MKTQSIMLICYILYIFLYDIAHSVNVLSNLVKVWSKATLVGLFVRPTFFSLFRALQGCNF